MMEKLCGEGEDVKGLLTGSKNKTVIRYVIWYFAMIVQ